ncbi:MAG: 30S ribosome-binding factor RbfA [Polyangiaceae bacterium]
MKRSARVAEGLMQDLAVRISQSLRDPRVRGAVVTRVDMSDDLRQARVYVRALEAAADDAKKKEMLDGLERASGMLRREATRALKLRVAPELKFFYDDGQDRRSRVDRLLAEIEHESKSKENKGEP